MKILITGGAGYIGSLMTKRLLDQNDEIVVADSLERGHKSAVDTRAILAVGNLRDKDFLDKLFNKHNFDAVIYFAGFISMGESMEKPFMYFDNNIMGALELLERMTKSNTRSFIFSSTAGVYGNPTQVPIPENHPKNPTNPYGESKSMVEDILKWYEKIFGINYVSLRYFNAAGAALDASLGEAHQPESHIIPNAMKAVLSNTEFLLYGDDYNTPDGTCIRDYIHVLDLVEAHVLALKKLQVEKGGFIYNAGTGKGFSNKEVLDMVKKVSGIEVRVRRDTRRLGDAEILVADVTKITNELGFSAKYSDLETIVKTAWEWHKR